MNRMPFGYPPLAYCTDCGRDFSGDRMFDRHRVGRHEYTFAQGMRKVPSREDGRRCLDADEMLERGWRTYTDDEMRASTRYRRRAGYGVELWYDPVDAARKRVGHAGRDASP